MEKHYVSRQEANGAIVVIHTDPAAKFGRILTGGLGTLLLWRGTRKPGFWAAVTALAGAELLSRACAGKSLLKLLADPDKAGGDNRAAEADAPSFHDEGIVTSQEPADDVEAASMASFPASDPPASHGSRLSKNATNPLKGDDHVND